MNHPDPVAFALSFVAGMRKSKWLRTKPTIRTATALSRLLVVRKIRKGRLIGEDYIECATLVTPPEDQEAAILEAEAILSAPIRLPVSMVEPTEQTAALAKILAELEMARRIEEEDDKDLPEQDIEDLLTDPSYKALLDEIGGVQSARARFENAESLKKAGQDLLRDRIGALDENLFEHALKLGLGPEIMAQSRSAAEKAAAAVVLGEISVEDAVRSQDSFDLQMKLLRLLKSAHLNISESLQNVADQAQSLGQLADVSALGHVEISAEQIKSAISHDLPDHSFEDLFAKTDQLATDVAQLARTDLYEKFPDLNEKQLSEHAQLCDQWKQALERAMTQRAEQAENATFEEGLSMLKDLFALSRSQKDPVLSQHLHEGIKGAAAGVVKRAKTLDELLELIHISDVMGCRLPPDMLREQGYDIGLSRHEMDQILYSRLSLLKKMIESDVKVYERFARLIDKERPGAQNTQRLAEVAIKKQNTAALAALGHYNLEWTLRAAEEIGDGYELIVESLSTGPGTNLLTQWFTFKDVVPEQIKKPLRKLAREMLIQYAVALGKELLGDRSLGLLEGETVRSFAPGDDLSLIDMDETLDNIISQGKGISMIAPDDFRVRETVHGRRAVVMVVDISGSMQGEKLTWCSIAAAMLAYALSPDELSLAFFESDTHVVKRFDDKMEMEEVADELLNLTSRGGTMFSQAVSWVTQELAQVGHRRKYALFLTDAAIYDLDQCAPPCRMLPGLQASSSWFVPESRWAEDAAKTLAKWSNGTLVRLHDNWRRFPGLISEALR